MLARVRSHLSFANVVSLLALFVALSGGAYALTIPKNSVGAKQLKRNSVGASKIKRGAVGSLQVRNGSLLSADFRAGQLPRGDMGPAGPQGPQGPQGPAGATNVVTRNAAGPGQAMVFCQPGETVVGGGGETTLGVLYNSSPVPPTNGSRPTGWFADSLSVEMSGEGEVTVYVLCARP
jgi:hypothetical protein